MLGCCGGACSSGGGGGGTCSSATQGHGRGLRELMGRGGRRGGRHAQRPACQLGATRRCLGHMDPPLHKQSPFPHPTPSPSHTPAAHLQLLCQVVGQRLTNHLHLRGGDRQGGWAVRSGDNRVSGWASPLYARAKCRAGSLRVSVET